MGYITKYVAILNAEKLEFGLTVFLHIKMNSHENLNIKNLMDAVQHMPEVLECYHVTGETDFLLKVLVPTMKDYEEFVVNKLTKVRGIGNINSHMVMSAVKQTTQLSF